MITDDDKTQHQLDAAQLALDEAAELIRWLTKACEDYRKERDVAIGEKDETQPLS